MDDRLLDRLRRELVFHQGAWPGFEAIRNPEDWLVFADALLEEGDERGALIHALHRYYQSEDVRQRAHAIGLQRDKPWLSSQSLDLGSTILPQVACGFAVSVGRSVDTLKATVNQLDHRDARLIAILDLDVDQGDPDAIVAAFTEAKALHRLRGLRLHGRGAEGLLARLIGIPNLAGIELFVGRVTSSDLESLAKGPWRLHSANLWHTGPDAQALSLSNAKGLAVLERLRLTDRSETLVAGLAQSGSCPKLRELRLRGIGSEASRAVAGGGLPALERVEARGFDGSIQDLVALMTSPALPRLTELSLRNEGPKSEQGGLTLRLSARGLEPAALAQLAASGALARVRVIDLGVHLVSRAWRMGPEGLEGRGLEALLTADLGALEELRLVTNALRADAMPALGQAFVPRLTLLDLSNNPLGIEGVQILVDSPLARQLRHFALMRVGLGLEGLERLAASPNLAGLRVLHLGDENLPVEAADILATSPHLRPHELRFSPYKIALPSLKTLATSPVMSQVRRLGMPLSALGSAGLETLIQSPVLRNLEVVDFGESGGLDSRADEPARELLKQALSAWPCLQDIRGVSEDAWVTS
ncbi:MAG: hypothetical protein AAGA48_32195 [Myxococcota bacterium]